MINTLQNQYSIEVFKTHIQAYDIKVVVPKNLHDNMYICTYTDRRYCFGPLGLISEVLIREWGRSHMVTPNDLSLVVSSKPGQNAQIDQFQYMKIHSKTINIATRFELVGINPTNSVVISTSLVVMSIVLD